MISNISKATIILILAGWIWTPGCAPTPPAATEKRINVLLVVVDTLRADRLGCLGNENGLTPTLDATAAEGVRFLQASAHSPWTLPSIASLLTSRHPSSHRAGEKLGPFRFNGLPPGLPLLQERFAESGYRTGAVINVDFLSRDFGMTRGFGDVDFAASTSNSDTRNAANTTDAAIGWLEKGGSDPFLLLVHYFDPHLEYDPPAEFRQRYAMPGDRTGRGPRFGSKAEMAALRQGRIGLQPLLVQRLAALYDAEVAFTDREIGRLLAHLETLGLDQSTLVVITADHGEEFGDHQGFEHGHTLYQELLHVPLVMRQPGRLPTGLAVEQTARLIDLAPTLLELADLPPVDSFAGTSLVPLIEGREQEDRPVFAEGNFWGPDIYCWRSEGYKLILEPENRVRLYHLEEDPSEQQDLSRQSVERRDRMLADLRWIMEQAEPQTKSENPVDLDADQVRRLRALGYLE